jgi:signal transduction histidine kinase
VSALVFGELLRRERLRNLDSQIESLSALLLNSDVIAEGIAELREADDIIQEIIGSYKLGLVIVLRNRNQKISFRNKNALALQLDPKVSIPWQFVQVKEDLIRINTSSRGNKILQLGLAADQEVIRPSFWSFLLSTYSLALLLVSGILAYLLTLGVLSPLKQLSESLNEMTLHLNLEGRSRVKLPSLRGFQSSGFFGRFDEFNQLIGSLHHFLDHLEGSLKIHGNQAALLAHEINTPITVVMNRISMLKKISDEGQKNQIVEIESVLTRLSDFVRRYLQFAESVHQPLSNTSLFAIRLDEALPRVVETIRSLPGGERLELKFEDSQTVFANPSDLDQLVSNLIRNALRYSPEDQPVLISLRQGRLSIEDFGPGIPEEIQRRWGEPFNKSKSGGSGLGLAWVKALCQKYRWPIRITRQDHKTIVQIDFSQSTA